MSQGLAFQISAHVVDILGNVIGRDQPILRLEKALEMVSLLGIEAFADDDVVFFDPFCKAGEILLACAFHRCWAKFKSKPQLTDVDMVFKEIYHSHRYFGLAPDERHHRLSMRTFLGNTHSHDAKFNHVIRDGHYLSEVDGTLDKEKFEREFNSMIEYITAGKKKLYVVGNPPYQEADGGAKASAKPIYNYFAEKIANHPDVNEYILVIPARWFSVGKGLDDFRENIRTSKEIRNIVYFERSEDVFPTVHVQGGVCYLNWSRGFNSNTSFIVKNESFNVDLSKYDIIPDDPYATPIIEKIMKVKVHRFVSDSAWSRKPFGLPTNFFSQEGKEVPKNTSGAIPCMVKGRKIKYVMRSEVKTNVDAIEKWKVVIPGAYATGARRCTLPKHQIFLLGKGEIATETYNVIDAFNNKVEAERLIQYLQSDFARYLLGLRKLTQHIPKDRWMWVPYLDMKQEWTDEKIFDYFKLTKLEREHIKKKVQEWS